ncbi:MAG: CBS domain-containing protein [Candidatus Latescibacteria bacterium]|nr:CBS domain-containing protein [Candidatus Latescibacterota bacterium]
MESSTGGINDEVLCPTCGHGNMAGADVCEECGQSIVADSVDPTEGDSTALSEPLLRLNPRQPEKVDRNATLGEAVARLKGHNVGCVLITDHGELTGIFTERDVLYRVAGLIENLDSVPVESLMTPQPTALKPSDPINRALHLMAIHGFRHVPLVDDDGCPVGIVSLRDIVGFMEEHFARPESD